MADIRDVLAAAREESLDIANSTGRRALLRVLREAEGDLARRLHQAEGLRGSGKQTFTEARMNVALAQVREVARGLQDDLGSVVTDEGAQVASASGEGVLAYMRAAERAFRGVNAVLPLREAMMLDAATQGAEASILRRLAGEGGEKGAGVLARYGEATVADFERKLRVGVAAQKPVSQVREELIESSPFLQGAPRSWAERIVRTELHGASNRAAYQAHVSAQKQLGDVVRILSATFDDRTGWDSYNVHGEIRRMSEPFEYVTYDGAHEAFVHPPNRPNDRELVLAHRLSWAIPPALRPRGTAEVQARAEKQGVKFPGRPSVMSTVPLGRFAAP
jgi:hypothetical protein